MLSSCNYAPRFLGALVTSQLPKLAIVPYRTKYYHNRHRDPTYRTERSRKVWKIELPDFDKMRRERGKMTPDESRAQFKERGVAPPIPWDERELYNPSTMGLIEEYKPPDDEKSSSLVNKLKSPLIGGAELVKERRNIGFIRTYHSGGFGLKEGASNIFAKTSSTILGNNFKIMCQQNRGFVSGSKSEYLDFRYRFNTCHLRSHLLIIRRQKMKKHKRKKFRKRFKSLLEKQRLKREIAKEKAFRVELLSIIKRAEQFDPREYALQKLAEVRTRPRERTKEERLEELKELIRVNRYQVDYIKPKHKRAELDSC